MKVMKVAIFAFVSSCIVSSVPVQAVLIKPANFVMPTLSSERFSFDLIVEELASPLDAKGFQSTVELNRPGLALDETASEAVAVEPSYWLYGNSAGANARDLGSNTYEFGDGPNQGNGTLGVNDSIVARYVFGWDGTDGLYTFTFDFADTNKNYVLGPPPDYESYALQLPEGEWYDYPVISADSSSFTVHIPEPSTLILLGLSGLVLLKRRGA